jgi:hypothetical protein
MTRHPKRVLWTLLAIAALALAGTAYAASPDSHAKPSGRHGNDRTIRLVETSAVAKPHFVDIDGLAYPNGAKAGVLRQDCTLVELGSNPLTSTYECAASFALSDGTIVAEGPFVPTAPEQTQAVTGGTAAFRAAQGEATIRAEDDEITIKLVG